MIGEEARLFKESDFGKCLMGMALQEAQEALDALAVANPTDYKEIERLQNRVWLGRNFEAFVEELIDKGKNAVEAWNQQKNRE